MMKIAGVKKIIVKRGSMKKKKDLIIGAAFFAISVGVFVSSFSIRKLVVSKVGSAFVPQLMAILLAGLSILLIVQALTAKVEPAPEKKPASGGRNHSVWLTFVLIFLYLALLEPLGFLLSTAVYLFFQFIVLSRKKPNLPLYGLLSISTSAIVYYLFVKVFILFLPAGILG
jgi:putative tricarboxylic transport membrane protein